MPTFDIRDIGEVIIKKSKLARRVTMRITPAGKPTVTIPRSVPYYLAKKMIWQKRDWIIQNRKTQLLLKDGDQIGSYQLQLIPMSASKITSRVANHKIALKYPEQLTLDSPEVQEAAHKAALRAIKNDAEDQLPPKLDLLAKTHSYKYSKIRLRNMRSRWGSCSTKGEISLNIWLMTLPEELIDYVCCHELAHLTHHNHSSKFWETVEVMIPDYKQRRKKLKSYSPNLQNLSTD